MEKGIIIRLATSEDAALIAELSRTTFLETFASENTTENMELFMSAQFSVASLEKEVGQPGNIFFLAFDDKIPCGYMRMRERPAPEGLRNLPSIEIARIYSILSSIGKGVGSALMKKALSIALDTGKKIIWLGVWEKNQRAIDFYTKWGFEKFGEQPFLLGNDLQTDWLMKKEL